jgi:iron complex transport system ATP-binding protein
VSRLPRQGSRTGCRAPAWAAHADLTVLSTLHDLTLAGQYANRLALLARGRVVAEGIPAEVLTPAALAGHYGARAEVVDGPHGPAVLPLRAPEDDRG